ncbi:MAG: hypothetical protein SPI25_00830 [Dialister sp.]|nr:hypothetical protein [Dialister sp.]
MKKAAALPNALLCIMDQIPEGRGQDVPRKEWAASYLQIMPETYDAWMGEYKTLHTYRRCIFDDFT